jgi:hypothetical protein
MKKGFLFTVSVVIGLALFSAPAGSEIQTVVGATLFGGAERGTEGKAGGVGGIEGFGIFPLAGNFGFQGSMRHEGGNAGDGGYRLGLSAGPVFGYANGKVGLNVDYQFAERTNANFFFLRGVWAHYFDSFDLVLSYSQPVHTVQHGDRNIIIATLPPA